MANATVDEVIEAYREALTKFVEGDPEPVTGFYSTRDDVTLANPLGPPRRGPSDVRAAIAEAASGFAEGGPLRFDQVTFRVEEISRFVTPDLAYEHHLERVEGRVAASGDPVVIALRVTMIYRREEGEWKVAHRHADPITTARPLSTTIQS
ncbi:Ketosteroid isomerase homolog [Actinokineospora alba]|uniref:Ketosteroid isomerase homolog n=1 Tax=Actinokineospora alba TaxID=504798 RepID=A0A1H0W9M1_9PSEU|nr:DUF4440 domain-containing protein [Actinokineospora alba]TDP66197.1 ketosteroid isomerase-like protein [Actinokineospora alba]SDJ42645.1 Ketosteroid isomerase homolog [Actinokineospora alba]SDP87469.1 Ketosteroid isomerase homolog [Actinokineospora alba]